MRAANHFRWEVGMERKVITCPHSGHLAEIGLERTSLGVVVTECSATRPGGTCDTECARRIDLRDRLAIDLSERVLVLHATTAAAAEAIAVALRTDAFVVDVADASARGAPPPEDYDVVVLVARRGVLGHARGLD